MTSPSNSRATIGGASDVGVVRDENEDSYGLWGPEGGDWDFLIAVADGVGGHEHGKQASELALSAFFSALLAKALPSSDAGIRSAMAAAMGAANGAVYSAFSGSGTSRPGSTFTCVLAKGQKCYVGHVGDSRAYMIHAGEIFQLSKDHTWVQVQVDNGTMTPEEAAVSPYRNQVLKVLGAEPQVDPDVVVRAIAPGDLFIVCSDGVTEHVDVNELLEQSTSAMSAEGLAQTLVALAVAKGGSDNATAVVAGVPAQVAAGGTGAKPETVEVPMLRQPLNQPDPKAASPAPPTMPLPWLGGRASSRRDWRPVVTVGLAVLLLVLGLVLVSVRRGRGDRPTEPSTPATPGPSRTTPTSSGNAPPSVGIDGPVMKLMRRLPIPHVVPAGISHRGDKFVAFTSDVNNNVALQCFDTQSGQRLFSQPIGDNEAPRGLTFSSDDAVVFHHRGDDPSRAWGPCATEVADGKLRWWKPAEGHDGGGFAASPDGRYLAVGDWSDLTDTVSLSATIRDPLSGEPKVPLRRAKRGYVCFQFNSDGTRLAALTGEGLRIAPTKGWRVAATRPDIHAFEMTDAGAGLAVWRFPESPEKLMVVDWSTGATMHEYATAPGTRVVAVSPSLKWCLQADDGAGTLTAHSLERNEPLQAVATFEPGHDCPSALSSDGRWLIVPQGDEVLIFETLPEYQ